MIGSIATFYNPLSDAFPSAFGEIGDGLLIAGDFGNGMYIMEDGDDWEQTSEFSLLSQRLEFHLAQN